ncbi:hypothetical protein [Nocardia coubleae]|uniref:Uncharacterized protein n=1 Tax=Nocardia coubleae TaxID=356147 RepID=A0A846W761_9NOCA|nr:hypothetical protein [Nocardia coubleae]NKX89172.1 hypothetical protein [Nocardia coubleae]
MIYWICEEHHVVDCWVEPEYRATVRAVGRHEHWFAQPAAEQAQEGAEGIHSRLTL